MKKNVTFLEFCIELQNNKTIWIIGQWSEFYDYVQKCAADGVFVWSVVKSNEPLLIKNISCWTWNERKRTIVLKNNLNFISKNESRNISLVEIFLGIACLLNEQWNLNWI